MILSNSPFSFWFILYIFWLMIFLILTISTIEIILDLFSFHNHCIVIIIIHGVDPWSWLSELRIWLASLMAEFENPLLIILYVKSWDRCNNFILSLFLNSLLKDIVNNVLYVNLTQEMLDELHDCFSHCNGPQIFQLKKIICVITQGQISIRNNNNNNISRSFLMGLNESFTHVRGHILLLETIFHS